MISKINFKIFDNSIINFKHLENCNWFLNNYELQIKLLLVVYAGFGNQVNVMNNGFLEHINELLIQVKDIDMFKIFYIMINNFSYLKSQTWFIIDKKIQNKLLKVIYGELAYKVDVMANNFSEHLDKLLIEIDQKKLFKLFYSVISNFKYLENQDWFIKNYFLQEKLLKIINKGLGEKIKINMNINNIVFINYIDNLLDSPILSG